MFKFFEYLTEKSNLFGSIGTERQGIRHLRKYVAPYLSAEQRSNIKKDFGKDFEKLKQGNGEKFDSNAENTHALSSPANGFETGTPVRITGARTDNNGNIFVQTEKHGEMPMSKIEKPSSLRTASFGKGGFDTESEISSNFGTTSAGASKSASDFWYGKNSELSGKLKKVDEDKPALVGESKQNKAKMGSSSLRFDPVTKKWDFTNPSLKEFYSKNILVNKKADDSVLKEPMNVLDYLNTHHKDGKIPKSFSAPAPIGSTREYLTNSGVNTLHLHRVGSATKKREAINHGTTYTVGDSNLVGNVGLGHLNDDEIDRLDGRMVFERGGDGSIRMSHQPNFAAFKEYADRSLTDPNQRNVHNKQHAEEVKGMVDRLISKKQPQKPAIQPQLQSTSEPNPETISQKTPKPRKTNRIAGSEW